MSKNLLNIKTVRIRNFRGYGENNEREDGYYEFNHLDSSIVLISGHNGLGKTSFYDAIEWCLTDNISRLDQLILLYGVNPLKDKHYLKFYCASELNKKGYNREVSVEVIFDNDTEIRRTTYFETLKLSENHNYSSKLFINNIEIINLQNQDFKSISLAKILLQNEDPMLLPDLLKSNFLSQENINALLRQNKPEERKTIIMKLLGFDSIEDIFNKATKLKNSRKLSKNRTIKESEIEISKINKERMLTKFSNLNTNSAKDYIGNLNNSLLIILKQVKESILLNSLDNSNIDTIKQFNYKNALDNIEIIEGQVKKYKEYMEINKKTIKEYNDFLIDINKLNVLRELKKILTKTKELNFISNEDIQQVTHQFKVEEANITEFYKRLSDNSIYTQDNNLNKQFSFEEALLFINTKNNQINESFWEKQTSIKEVCDNIFKKFLEYNVILDSFKNDYSTLLNQINIDSLKTNYDSLIRESVVLQEKIKSREEIKNTMNSMNIEYSMAIEPIKDFLIKNKDTKECPVCLNNTLKLKKHLEIINEEKVDSLFSEKLITILDNSIANGNAEVEKIVQKITKLKKDKEEIENTIKVEIIDKLYKNIQSISELYKSIVTILKNTLKNDGARINENIRICNNKITDYSQRIALYEKLIEKHFVGIGYNPEILKDTLIKYENKREELGGRLTEKYNYLLIPSEEIIDKDISLIRNQQPEILYNKGMDLVEKQIDVLNSSNSEVDRIIILIETEIIKNKLDDDNYAMLSEFDEIDKRIQQMKESLINIQNHEDLVAKIIDDSNKILIEVTENILKNHKIINWIYEFINPHPFYKKAVFSPKNKGILVTDESGNICLDHIYSSAQMNILALSIFLGIGLSGNFSSIGQLFLDDPIQSMDDIKIYSFIDLLRGILDSQESKKKLVISTHDDNFAKLLSIKMRNRQFTHYHFDGYTEEGPIYTII